VCFRAHIVVGALREASAATVVPQDPAPTTATFRLLPRFDVGSLTRSLTAPDPSTDPTVGFALVSSIGHRHAVLIPVKAFSAAKRRLAERLSAAARAELAEQMANVVVSAASPLPVYVVCDDDAVAAWAQGAGAQVLWRPGAGLNGAVTDGVASLGEAGFERVIVAHGDLPLARSLAWVGSFDGVTIVPDRREDGTNVICVPAGAGFGFAYGAGSFRRHAAVAVGLGLPVRVVRRPLDLGHDVDVPDDLVAATS
jgi:2-phospho-L-lactate/phosphoenolpyruvate guanylyltransferase